MNEKLTVQIIGAPIACAEGIKDSWRDTANWAAKQLHQRFGDAVQMEYYDLFDPSCPALPPNAQLPLVLVEGEVISSGGKIPMPAIRKRLEALLLPTR
ncbi:MAG: hypothetical protein LCI00_12830 [Chloroflexi bacterium]|nr:hypothetical protein [Chloroflexota bacterium]